MEIIKNISGAQKIGLCIFVHVFVSLIGLFIFYKSPKILIGPDGCNFYKIISTTTSCDKEHGGNSIVEVLESTPQRLSYGYEYREGYKFKYTTSGFRFDSLLNLSGYDYMHIRLRSKIGKRIIMGVYYFEGDSANLRVETTMRLSQYLIDVSPEFTSTDVYFNELFTPAWWYAVNNALRDKPGVGDLSQIRHMYFSGCLQLENNIRDQVEIDEISFHVSFLPYLVSWGILSVLFYGVLGVLFFTKFGIHKAPIKFEHSSESIGEYSGTPHKVLNYLTQHYHQPDLTISDVCDAVGLSEKVVSQEIKSKTGLSFRVFLNELRLSEAKRLLLETDFQISEIAFKVGYGNVSHFNKVFKLSEECSPNEFRKKSKNE